VGAWGAVGVTSKAMGLSRADTPVIVVVGVTKDLCDSSLRRRSNPVVLSGARNPIGELGEIGSVAIEFHSCLFFLELLGCCVIRIVFSGFFGGLVFGRLLVVGERDRG